MKKERKYKYEYIYISDMLYCGALVMPIVASLFSVLFILSNQLIIGHALIVLVILLLISLFAKIKTIKNSIHKYVANHIIYLYLKDCKYYYLKKVVFDANKTTKETIDYVVITENGIILINIYGTFYVDNDKSSSRFIRENKIISKIEKLVEDLNKEKLKGSEINFEELPMIYILAYSDDLLYVNTEGNEENKNIVRKNAYEVPSEIKRFNQQNSIMKFSMDKVSALYHMFKKMTVEYNKKRKIKINK